MTNPVLKVRQKWGSMSIEARASVAYALCSIIQKCISFINMPIFLRLMTTAEYGEMTVVFDDVRFVTYNFTQLDELELAYAVTVHKSQGSEFPIVIMPISWFPPVLATRNLLYTGVTRGKQIVVLVGSEDKLNAMVDNNRISYRYSGLDYRLKKFFEFE